MTLGELVTEYRTAHGLSQRQFAITCDLSNGYISMLEKNLNPKTGLPVTPSLPALKKIANGMGITVTDLFVQVDDMPVDLLMDDQDKTMSAPDSESGHSNIDIELALLITGLSPEKKNEALNYLRYLAERAES